MGTKRTEFIRLLLEVTGGEDRIAIIECDLTVKIRFVIIVKIFVK